MSRRTDIKIYCHVSTETLNVVTDRAIVSASRSSPCSWWERSWPAPICRSAFCVFPPCRRRRLPATTFRWCQRWITLAVISDLIAQLVRPQLFRLTHISPLIKERSLGEKRNTITLNEKQTHEKKKFPSRKLTFVVHLNFYWDTHHLSSSDRPVKLMSPKRHISPSDALASRVRTRFCPQPRLGHVQHCHKSIWGVIFGVFWQVHTQMLHHQAMERIERHNIGLHWSVNTKDRTTLRVFRSKEWVPEPPNFPSLTHANALPRKRLQPCFLYPGSLKPQ